MKKFDIFIFAGEASADILGHDLIKEVKLTNPKLNIFGVTGPQMQKLNIHKVLDIKNFQVMGFSDVFFSIFPLLKNFFLLKKTILKYNPKVCILIDSPDLTLNLAKHLKKANFQGKIVQYVSPTVWAWRKNRTKKIKKYIDLLLSIFPFEKEYFKNQNIPVKYIGNPFVFKVKNYKYENSSPLHNYIGIFPGSRRKEIEKNLPIQLLSLKRFTKEHKFIISVANKNLFPIIQKIAKQYNFKNLIFYPPFKKYDLLKNLKFAIATSGTINLELALLNIPTIVTYSIKPIDLFIAKNVFKINLKHYCIVNILANKLIFPELYGPNLTLKNLNFYITKMLKDKSFFENTKKDCEKIKKILKGYNASQNASRYINKFF